MYLHPHSRVDISAACARAQRICTEIQLTRWEAARARHRARLTRLVRHMPQANSLTLAITAKILEQHGLLAHAPTESSPEARQG